MFVSTFMNFNSLIHEELLSQEDNLNDTRKEEAYEIYGTMDLFMHETDTFKIPMLLTKIMQISSSPIFLKYVQMHPLIFEVITSNLESFQDNVDVFTLLLSIISETNIPENFQDFPNSRLCILMCQYIQNSHPKAEMVTIILSQIIAKSEEFAELFIQKRFFSGLIDCIPEHLLISFCTAFSKTINQSHVDEIRLLFSILMNSNSEENSTNEMLQLRLVGIKRLLSKSPELVGSLCQYNIVKTFGNFLRNPALSIITLDLFIEISLSEEDAMYEELNSEEFLTLLCQFGHENIENEAIIVRIVGILANIFCDQSNSFNPALVKEMDFLSFIEITLQYGKTNEKRNALQCIINLLSYCEPHDLVNFINPSFLDEIVAMIDSFQYLDTYLKAINLLFCKAEVIGILPQVIQPFANEAFKRTLGQIAFDGPESETQSLALMMYEKFEKAFGSA